MENINVNTITNKELSEVIRNLRSKVNIVDGGEIGLACIHATILLVSNVEKPFWKDIPKWKFWVNPKNNDEDPYFLSKSNFELDKGQHHAVYQILKYWNRSKVVNVEFFMRSAEVLLREYTREYPQHVKEELLTTLEPLLGYGNQMSA